MERDLEGSRRAQIETHPDHLPGKAEKNHLNLTKYSQSGAVAMGRQVSVLHRLQIWLHPLGICRTSKTNMLMKCEPHKDEVGL